MSQPVSNQIIAEVSAYIRFSWSDEWRAWGNQIEDAHLWQAIDIKYDGRVVAYRVDGRTTTSYDLSIERIKSDLNVAEFPKGNVVFYRIRQVTARPNNPIHQSIAVDWTPFEITPRPKPAPTVYVPSPVIETPPPSSSVLPPEPPPANTEQESTASFQQIGMILIIGAIVYVAYQALVNR